LTIVCKNYYYVFHLSVVEVGAWEPNTYTT
jgi:hypothetical protein